MLDFSQGTREIRIDENTRLTVFPDSSEVTRYHYLPNYPHIATMQDGTPGIRLFVYREDLSDIGDEEPEAVGFLSLDVDLSWPTEVLDKAASKIRLEDNLTEKPILTPIFFREGTTKLMLLDAQTPDDDGDSSDDIEPTQFVTSILGQGSPSLYGDNRAIFQAALTKKGAAALTGSIDGMMPIGVVYSLTFAGLQKAFNIKASIKWEKVHEHFSEQEKTNLLFYEKDIQKSIDSLVEDKVIVLESTIEGIGAEAMDAERKEVMDSVRQIIFEKFFEATFKREEAVGDSTADDVVDTLTAIHRNAFTFGVGHTYRKKEVTIKELRTFNLDWSVRRAAERTIYPQAHMHVMMDEWGVTQQQLVKVIDGSDALWKTTPFEVIAAAAWDDDAIVAITVDIEYEDADSGALRSWTTTLDKAKSRDVHRDWMDRTSGSAFRYKYSVVFSPDGVRGPQPIVDSGEEWLEHDGTVLVIHPRELYDTVRIEAAALANFPFDRWPTVHAMVRYRDTNGFEFYDDQLITSVVPTLKSSFRINRGVNADKELRLSYFGAGGERVDTDWTPLENDDYPIQDPYTEKLDVMVVVSGDRDNVATAIVDLEYEDTENGVSETGRLTFLNENIATPQNWSLNLADTTKRRYRYRMTLITKDTGDFMQTSWISTDAPTVAVGADRARRMTIEVLTGEIDEDFSAVEVTLRYPDSTDGDDHNRTFRLGPNERAEWMVQLSDPGKRDYEVTIRWISTTGFHRTVGPTIRSSSLIAVAASPPD